MWATLLVPAALAAGISTRGLPVDAEVHAAAAAPGLLALATAGEVLLVDPSTGAIDQRLPRVVEDLAWLPTDAGPVLLLCGPEGLVRVDADGTDLGVLDLAPCLAVAAAGPTLLGAADGASLRAWQVDPHGLWTLRSWELAGPPLLDGREGHLLAGVAGLGTLLEVDADEARSLALDAEATGLAWVDGEAWIADAAAPRLLATSGATWALDRAPGRLGGGDLDRDGREDLALLAADGALLLLTQGRTLALWLELPLGGRDLDLADLDGDGCEEIVAVDDLGLARVVELDPCGVEGDADGDGFSAEAGDCDDADATVWPGADERCDGKDQDCDELVDESERVILALPGAPAEGEAFSTEARVEGCRAPTAWTWELVPLQGLDEPPLADCAITGAWLSCALLDDGELLLHVAASDAAGTFAEADATLLVADVAPVLVTTGELSGPLADGLLQVEPGSPREEQLLALDPGTDTVRFRLDGPPTELLVVEPEGLLLLVPETEDELGLTLVVADDEGLATRYAFRLDVDSDPWDDDPDVDDDDPPDDDPEGDTGSPWSGCGQSDVGPLFSCTVPSCEPGCGGCCGGGGLAAVLLPLWALRRRRRP